MLKFGFFNSVNGDRVYGADDITNFFLKVISDGVFDDSATNFEVTAGGSMIVSVAPGWGAIKSKYVQNTAAAALMVDESDVSLDRIDRVKLRYSQTNRAISLIVDKGTPGSTPTPPALTRTSDVYDLSLAQVYVSAGATEITSEDITDERSNPDVCGYVKSLINGAAFDMLHGLSFVKKTQTEYDEIQAPDENTVYIIVNAEE